MRTIRRVINKLFPSTTPSWKIAMNVIHPDLARPRFLSLHTLATVTGRSDLLKLAKEMKRSCEVGISFCPTVKSPVFHLYSRRRDGNDPDVWGRIESFIETWPFPKYKGFYGSPGRWTGGGYGMGRFIQEPTGMAEPFIKEDYRYANKIIKALRTAGREPGIQEYNI